MSKIAKPEIVLAAVESAVANTAVYTLATARVAIY